MPTPLYLSKMLFTDVQLLLYSKTTTTTTPTGTGIGKMQKCGCKVRNARDWLTSKATWPCPFCNLPLHVLQLMEIKCGKVTLCVITSKDCAICHRRKSGQVWGSQLPYQKSQEKISNIERLDYKLSAFYTPFRTFHFAFYFSHSTFPHFTDTKI